MRKKNLYVRVHDDEGRIKLPSIVVKKMKLHKGSILVVSEFNEEVVVLRKVKPKIEELEEIGPKLSLNIDEENELEETKTLIYEMI